MCHDTAQQLQHPPGVKERDLSPVRAPLPRDQWSEMRWETMSQP